MVGVLLAEFTCAAMFSVLALAHEVSGRQRALDVMLRGRADSVLGAIQDAEDRDDNVIVDEAELPLPREDAYEVVMASGRIAGESPGTKEEVLRALAAARGDGYFSFKADGRHYRAIRQPGLRVIDREEQVGGLRRPVTILYAMPTERLWHQALEAARFYVLVSCLLLLVTGFALAWFLRRSLSPLRELARRAEVVSVESWEFEAPAETLAIRELQPMARSIETLLRGLRAAFERQRRFTGDAAHELKTSIALLNSSLQLIELKERTTEEYRASLEDLLNDTQRMENLTARMLTLARVEEASLEPDGEADLAEALRLVVARLVPAATLKGVTVMLNAAAQCMVCMEMHDADLLCSNLLMNAVEHSVRGGTIWAAVSGKGEAVELTIRDGGEGIAAEALPYIFERFYRGDASRSRMNGGAGLGLAICKAIVTRAGGKISAESELGKRTTMRVTLPAARA
jgi:signal transduction histidine kinase